MLWRITADFVIAIHLTYIAFVLFGFAAILAGAAAQWRWVRNFYFRIMHLATILLVCAEAAIGTTCPLTSLESALRLRGGEAGYGNDFIGYWLDRFVFYDAPRSTFLAIYFTFGVLVLISFWIVPAQYPRTESKVVFSALRVGEPVISGRVGNSVFLRSRRHELTQHYNRNNGCGSQPEGFSKVATQVLRVQAE